MLLSSALAHSENCVALNVQKPIIYRAGSLTRSFKPLEARFTCETGVEIKDVAMRSVDAGRQITAGGQDCDLYAPADYSDIDLLMKPAGYADFNIVFAQGKMVLAYSAASTTEKKLPPVAAPGTPFHVPDSIPDASPDWYKILIVPGVTIGGGNPFLDPGAYRAKYDFSTRRASLQCAEPFQQSSRTPDQSWARSLRSCAGQALRFPTDIRAQRLM